MPIHFTAQDLFEAAKSNIADHLENETEDSEVYYSPDMFDLVIWNIVIAFVVNFAASAAYETITNIIRQKGGLSRKDLKDHENVIKQQTISVETPDLGTVKIVIANTINSEFEVEVTRKIAEKVAQDLVRISTQGNKES